MKRLLACFVALLGLTVAPAQSVYDYSVKNAQGKEVPLSAYKGKVLLIVNTATHCGFTPQYRELEALYARYREEGLEILDFPCNQFGQQAPGTMEEIREFCELNYDTTFPLFEKLEVNGAAEAPLYTYLKAQQGFGGFKPESDMAKRLDGMLRTQDAEYDKKSDIKWNFTKFLVARDGRVVRRFEPVEPLSAVEAAVVQELNPVLSTILARRSVRRYLDTPVEHKTLELLMQTSIHAPSAMNRQQWAVSVVEDQELIAQVSEVYKEEQPQQVSRDPHFKNMFRNAPNLICVSTPKGESEFNAGLLCQNIMLAAQSMGLGTCCLGAPVRYLKTSEKAKFFINRLEIPEGYELSYIIAVGYPDEQPQPKPRDASKVKFIR